MPSESPLLPAQTEKPHHYAYLKEFRTQQCPLFLQHKCTQHRPYTCFHWHFMNQRRRRPVRKRDGTFNYSPDVYCTKFDETTGICPEGDECPYLHRTAGDTERRYHLRYYKTCTCVYETDARGHCAKNGPHCAFAHGVHDLRPPVYDVREVQGGEVAVIGSPSSVVDSPLGTSLEKDRIINEDPRWNDTNYVLANYKTEQCKRPPRLCRQGYACPSFHNTRDRRRSPKTFKYRSTPCPNVKHGDDWGDPSQCESGDNCPYCHTRTEQQFHPEIYKSTKCNDMVQNGYCPRGPFCAFAHVEHEMTTQRDAASSSGDTSLAAFVTNALPDHLCDTSGLNRDKFLQQHENGTLGSDSTGDEIFLNRLLQVSKSVDSTDTRCTEYTLSSSMPDPIGKGRASSFCSSIASECSNSSYQKAPGFEREDSSYNNLGQQLQAIEMDSTLDPSEKSKRKQNLLLLHNLNGGGSGSLSSSIDSNPTTPSLVSSVPPTMSPLAPSFYPAGDTVESVIGNALDEDLNIGELSLSSLDREVSRDNDNDTNSVCSSLSTGFPVSSYIGATSVPVNIPSSSGGYQRNSLGSLSQSPCSSPIGSLPLTIIPQHLHLQQKQEQQIHEAASAFLSQPNPGKFSAPGFIDQNSMSPRSMSNSFNGNGNISQSPLLSGGAFAMNGFGEVQRLKEELGASKAKLHQWEEGMSQARSACEAWKKEAEGSSRKAKSAEEERYQAIKQRDEAVLQLAKTKQDLDILRMANSAPRSPFLPNLQRLSEVENLPVHTLRQLQAQLLLDLESVEKVLRKTSNQNMKCTGSQDQNHSIGVLPSNQFVFCEK